MKVLITTMMIATSIFGQSTRSTFDGPIFDATGHFAAYVYSDGKKDTYAYDSQWRMIRFTDRDGNVTSFTYGADGSMKILKPDRSR